MSIATTTRRIGKQRRLVTGLVITVVVAVVAIVGPWLWRLAQERDAERLERIRTQERGEIAARVHDSVLQTLTLIQRHADDPRRIASLARQQERELRSSLYGREREGTLVAALERAAASPEAPDDTFYLLGYANAQAKNFPKAIAALEKAAAKTPNNVEVYRLLGFSYESSKDYTKALAAYEKGLQLAPADAYFKESADRVRPFAK